MLLGLARPPKVLKSFDNQVIIEGRERPSPSTTNPSLTAVVWRFFERVMGGLIDRVPMVAAQMPIEALRVTTDKAEAPQAAAGASA